MHFTSKQIQKDTINMKKCPTSLVNREMQIKATGLCPHIAYRSVNV